MVRCRYLYWLPRRFKKERKHFPIKVNIIKEIALERKRKKLPILSGPSLAQRLQQENLSSPLLLSFICVHEAWSYHKTRLALYIFDLAAQLKYKISNNGTSDSHSVTNTNSFKFFLKYFTNKSNSSSCARILCFLLLLIANTCDAHG